VGGDWGAEVEGWGDGFVNEEGEGIGDRDMVGDDGEYIFSSLELMS